MKAVGIACGNSVNKYGTEGPALFVLMEDGDIFMRDELTDKWEPVCQKQLGMFYKRIENGTAEKNVKPRIKA